MNNVFKLFNNIVKPSTTNKDNLYIIAGLGNPGKDYENTRHNAGFMAIDLIAQKYNTRADKFKYNALYNNIVIDGKKVILLKPQTYMNLSGQSIKEVAYFYNISIENILVIFDDISLDIGKMRIRRKGSSGGHNGVKSIINCMGTDKFPRIKIGIGQKSNPNWDLADWVLSKFTNNEIKALNPIFNNTLQAVEMIVSNNMQDAMNKYNS